MANITITDATPAKFDDIQQVTPDADVDADPAVNEINAALEAGGPWTELEKDVGRTIISAAFRAIPDDAQTQVIGLYSGDWNVATPVGLGSSAVLVFSEP